jgi:hypothetical protein
MSIEIPLSNDSQDATATLDTAPRDFSLKDFYAYLPTHQYIAAHSGQLWPRASVNAQVPPLLGEDGKPVQATDWLDRNRPIEQFAWAPGKPLVIHNRLMMDAGWIDAPGSSCFNVYRAPPRSLGDPKLALPWLEHLRRLYPTEAEHLMHWFAYKAQNPGEKINHAVVLGGKQGIGKDMMLEAAKRAVGLWNVADIAPGDTLKDFNGFVRSVILCISEASDLGEVTRKAFYERTKTLITAPPYMFRCNEKYIPHRNVQNVCGVVITTNHKTDGIYLHPDDRRHFVAWSPMSSSDFAPDYFLNLQRWYEQGGYEHVAALLQTLDLSDFNAKAPPPKTPAFWEIVHADQSSEDAELADALDRLGRPEAVTLGMLITAAKGQDLELWLEDKRNRRQVPNRLETAGYVHVRNETAPTDGLWRVRGKRQVVYVRKDLSMRARFAAAEALCRGAR